MATQLGETLDIYDLKKHTHSVVYGPGGEPQFKEKRRRRYSYRNKRLYGYSSHRPVHLYRFRWNVLEKTEQLYQRVKPPQKGLFIFFSDGIPPRI